MFQKVQNLKKQPLILFLQELKSPKLQPALHYRAMNCNMGEQKQELFNNFLRNISEIQTLILILWAFEKHLHLSYLNITVLQFRGGEKIKS